MHDRPPPGAPGKLVAPRRLRTPGAFLLVAACLAACDSAPARQTQASTEARQPLPSPAAPAYPGAAAPRVAASPLPAGFVAPRLQEGAAPMAPQQAATGADASAATPPPAPPPSAAELTRKRAEWQEHLRQAEQAQVSIDAWQKSRRPDAPRPMPRIAATFQPAAAPVDPLTQSVHAWYRRYSARSKAVTMALDQFRLATSATPQNAERLLTACTGLRTSADALLADPEALAAPVDAISRPLGAAYTEIKATAESCLAGHPDNQSAHLNAARQSMLEAGVALNPYHLAP